MKTCIFVEGIKRINVCNEFKVICVLFNIEARQSFAGNVFKQTKVFLYCMHGLPFTLLKRGGGMVPTLMGGTGGNAKFLSKRSILKNNTLY